MAMQSVPIQDTGGGRRPPPNTPAPTKPPSSIDLLVNPDYAKNVKIHALTGKLSTIHPKILKQGLLNIVQMPIELKRLRDGDIQIIVSQSKQTKALLALNEQDLCGFKVQVSCPAAWNTVRGVISGPSLRLLTDEDIIECQHQDDGIIAAKHWERTNNETRQREPSNTVCITFHNEIIPTHVHIGLERYPVALHIPNPLKCFKCQEFGHHNSNCKNAPICAKCCSTEHEDKNCQVAETNYKCKNCQGNHASWSRSCQIFIKEKKVCEYKAIHKVSYYEARQAVIGSKAAPYAQAVTAVKIETGTQTPLHLNCKSDIINATIITEHENLLYINMSGRRITPTKPTKPTNDIGIGQDPEMGPALNLAECSGIQNLMDIDVAGSKRKTLTDASKSSDTNTDESETDSDSKDENPPTPGSHISSPKDFIKETKEKIEPSNKNRKKSKKKKRNGIA